MSLQNAVLILIPLITPLVGTSVAAIIAQNHWPAWANDTLAWAILLLFAGGDMWANSQFAGGWVTIAADAVQAITLLSSGWLVKLDPWLTWLNWLQGNLFNLVPLFEDLSKPMPVNSNPVRVPVAITLPPPQGGAASVPVPPRASAPPDSGQST